MSKDSSGSPTGSAFITLQQPGLPAVAYGRKLPPASRIATGSVLATPSVDGCQKQKAPPLNQEAGLF